jgi:insulysin
MRCMLLVHGNATASEAAELTDLVCEKMPFLPLPHSQLPTRRVIQLATGGTGASYMYRQHAALLNPEEPNSAVENVYMLGLAHGMGGAEGDVDSLSSVRAEAMLELLSHMMSEPAFDQLRTKEQLGYIVFTGTI